MEREEGKADKAKESRGAFDTEFESNLRNMILNSPVAMCILMGTEYVVEIANERMFELWGKSKDQMRGKPIFEGLPEVRAQGFEELLKEVYSSGETFSAKERPVYLPRNGTIEIAYINFVYDPFRNSKGEIIGVMAVAIDVTDQVKARIIIEEKNQELSFVTDIMPQMMWATESNGLVSFFNRRWMEYTGIAYEQLLGEGWLKTLHPDDFEKTIFTWNHSINTGEPYEVEYRVRRYDGVYRWFLVRGTPMKDSSGNILKWYGSNTDIEDQKQHENNLHLSNERFNLVARATQDAVWDWDLKAGTIWRSEGFQQLFGYYEADFNLSPESWMKRIHPEDRSRVSESLNQFIESGENLWSDEYRFQKKDGQFATVFDRGYVLKDEQGNAYRMLGSMQDITERKHAEERIRNSELMFRNMATMLPAVIWTATPDGQLNFISRQWETYYGNPIRESLGSGWAEFVHPDDKTNAAKVWQDSLETGTEYETEFRVLHKSGIYRWVLVRALPIKDNKGDIVRWYGSNTDIQEKKQFQEDLEQRVKERTYELEMRNKELEEFTYVSSHDLQEPLRKILIFSEMISSDKQNSLSNESEIRLHKLRASALRMSAALGDLLNFASLDKEDQFVHTDLNDIVDSVKSDLELLLNKENVSFHSDKLPVVAAIPHQMHQLFYNLVNNGLKFAKPGERSNISILHREVGREELAVFKDLDPAKRYYELSFKDNGIGFNPELSEKIFRMFQRLHAKETYPGTGIGLALCKKVVLNHQGKIWAESIPDDGSIFKVMLPVQ
jgi:PAS domain S-box-containing protein